MENQLTFDFVKKQICLKKKYNKRSAENTYHFDDPKLLQQL